MAFLLDSNILIYAFKNMGAVRSRIAQHDAVFDRGREHCMNESVALRDRRGARLARCDHAGAPRADPAR